MFDVCNKPEQRKGTLAQYKDALLETVERTGAAERLEKSFYNQLGAVQIRQFVCTLIRASDRRHVRSTEVESRDARVELSCSTATLCAVIAALLPTLV